MTHFTSLTIIRSPYHTGLRDHRVGDGPNRITSRGIADRLGKLGIKIFTREIERVDTFEGEIGRSFEILARTSLAVSEAIATSSFPLVLSGNCMASVGVACGLGPKDLGYIYFDAHDDLHTPSTLDYGYFDAMGLPILAGKSFHAVAATIPGFQTISYDKHFLFCGLRESTGGERERVQEYGMDAIWGSPSEKTDYVRELSGRLSKTSISSALVHLDLDVLDESVGKVNGFETPGGMSVEDLVGCMTVVPQKTNPRSLVVCSFDPNLGDGDKIADIAIGAVVAFMESMLRTGQIRSA